MTLTNKAVSKLLIDDLKKLPAKIHAAGLVTAIYELPLQTHQDSGNAAFNWIAESGKTTARIYKDQKGTSPVGVRGDDRTNSGLYVDQVSIFRALQAYKLTQAVRQGSVKITTVSNPIVEIYAENAELEFAKDRASKLIEDAMLAAAKSGVKK